MIATDSMLDDRGQPRQEIITRVEENAGAAWVRSARGWLEDRLTHHLYLLPGDAQHTGCPAPATTWRAMGGVYQWGLKHGLMVEDGTAKRPNGTVARRYRSLIYTGPRS